MKKSVVLAILGIAAMEALGQGQILFSNYWSSHQTTGIYYGNGPYAGLGVGSEMSVELLYGPSTAASVSQLVLLPGSITPVGLNGVTAPAPLGAGGYAGAGVFYGGTVLVPGTPGVTYAFAIYVFGTSDGIYWQGFSGIYTGTTQATAIDRIPNLPDGLYQGSISLWLIPEPSTVTLGGLGLAALLLARRKKSERFR